MTCATRILHKIARRSGIAAPNPTQTFEGQGGQKGGSQERSKQGTGYTRDRSSKLQEDESLSSSPARQSKSGSRKAESPPKNVSTREEREESEDSHDDVDRSLM